MRSIAVALLICILSSVAKADGYYGCYSTNFLSCSYSTVTCNYDTYLDQAYYGYTVAMLCKDIGDAAAVVIEAAKEMGALQTKYDNLVSVCGEGGTKLTACQNSYNAKANDLSACSSNWNTEYNYRISTVKSLNKRIKKMKKICGYRCKKL